MGRQKLSERYTLEPTSGCWLWTGKVNERGYGRLVVAGKYYYAHRVAWEQWRGPIPDGMCLLHKCDTPTCINPDHLFLGTKADNMHDMWGKGRGSKPPRNDLRGERAPSHKLTQEQIVEIRNSPDLQRVLAERYGVRQNTISRIKTGRRWAHLNDQSPVKQPWKRS